MSKIDRDKRLRMRRFAIQRAVKPSAESAAAIPSRA